MYNLLFVATGGDTFAKLEQGLHRAGRTMHDRADSGNATLQKIAKNPFDLILVDEQLFDMKGINLARQVVAKNPFINIALVSHLCDAEFHDATEGLGILAKLSPEPAAKQAVDLLQKLDAILKA
jgi:two-component SAPR family response regulator